MKGVAVKGSQQDLVLFLISFQHVNYSSTTERERKSLKGQEMFEDGMASLSLVRRHRGVFR